MLNSIIDKIRHLDEHRHVIDRVADVNAIISGVALYPQLFKLIYGGPTAGLSLFTFLTIGLSSILWIVYAMHRKSLPILLSSGMNCIAALGIVFIIIVR